MPVFSWVIDVRDGNENYFGFFSEASLSRNCGRSWLVGSIFASLLIASSAAFASPLLSSTAQRPSSTGMSSGFFSSAARRRFMLAEDAVYHEADDKAQQQTDYREHQIVFIHDW